jgi:serine/threonine protein kinase
MRGAEMECLDANDLQDLMSGMLSATQRGRVLGHLDTCEDCREVLSITASDVVGQSLPAFHEHEAGLAATMAPGGQGAALLATQAASDGPEDAGDAPTMLPQDMLETPVMRRASTAPVTQGKRLGRYTMTDRLGAGAMGVVWRAEDPKLGRNVALKVLRRVDPALTERLVREARSMAQVNHPNVVTVYEVGTAEDGTPFIAMELVTGQSLRTWQSSKKHAVPELVSAYIAAGRGLAAAHAAGIVHRDFKPDNVLVGDDGRIRVTDFGLAAAKPLEGGIQPNHIGDVNLTTSGSVLGTPAYMAPEQFTGGNVDSRTDQFNFCVALYEALFGERPFDGKTFQELGDNVTAAKHRPVPAGANVSSALRGILMKGMSTMPGDRFPTMNDLIGELGRDRAKPWRRTAWVSAAMSAALLLGLVSDWAVRDRLAGEIRQSFSLTGAQLERAVGQLRDQFDTVSQIAYREPALREVAGHHDQADFGLGSPEDDHIELERLHNTLVSTDWVRIGTSTLAIADYKGRVLYTSAAPNDWGGDLTLLPFVKRSLDAGKGDSVTVVPYLDPALAATHVLGAAPGRPGLAVVFTRTLALGDKATEGSEARAIYLQVQDGQHLLDNVRLDRDAMLALVAPSGQAAGDPGLSPWLVQAALASPATGGVSEIEDDGRTYQVQVRPIQGLDGQGTIAHVVMARPLAGVLSLFPGARVVFAVAALAALLLSIATFWRARGVTRGHI